MSRIWALSPVYLAWTDSSGTYRTFTFDVVEDEQWVGPADITTHPVEVGAKIADNIRPGLRRCTLKVIATNEPVAGNQWSDASIQSAGPLTVTNPRAIALAASFSGGAPAVSITPGDGLVDVPEWDSKLQLRILAGSAAGLVGGAIGGTAGAVVGAVGGALANALLQDKVRHDLVQTNTPQVQAKLALAPPETISPKVLTFNAPGDFVRQTLDLLEELRVAGQTIDVWGTKSQCIGPGASSSGGGPSGIGGMAIAELSHTRNHAEGTGASITITLEEIRIVYTQTVPAPKPTAVDATASVSKGNQGTFDMEADAQAEETTGIVGEFKRGVALGTAAALQ